MILMHFVNILKIYSAHLGPMFCRIVYFCGLFIDFYLLICIILAPDSNHYFIDPNIKGIGDKIH